MERWSLSLGMGGALVACLVMGRAESARASTRSFQGSLTFQLATLPGATAVGGLMPVVVNGSSSGTHVSTMQLMTSTIGPVTTSIPVTHEREMPYGKDTRADQYSSRMTVTPISWRS